MPHADPARDGNPNTLAGYQWIYGEDQDTYAITLNGEAILDGSFALELNLKTDFYDTRECRNLFGISGVGVPDLGGLPVGAAFGLGPPSDFANNDAQGTIPGCDIGNADVYTLLGNFTRSVGTDLLGADKISTVFDVSMVWIDGMSFGDGTDRVNTGNVDTGSFDGVDALDRPITDFSWGYTAVLALEYNDVFANVNVSPTIIFVHNVEGYTPFNAGALVENQRTIVAKIGFSYLSSTTLDLQYTTWLGTAGVYEDRDNVSLVFKRSF